MYYKQRATWAARTAARAADRSDHFGRLLSYSTVYSDSTYIQGTRVTTGYMRGVCTGGGYNISTKLLYIELSRSSNGYFKPLLDPGGGFTSETAARRF